MKTNKLYIPGLNGIRAIAALIVLFSHIDEFAYKFEIRGTGLFEKGLANYGVTLFFTLSGFLITYLLLLEGQPKINIKRFYIRRMLRIWPIYYLAIIITILLFPLLSGSPMTGDIVPKLSLYLFFLPNLAYALNWTIFTITSLWSVGVEEQFYLLWPWLIKRSPLVFKTSCMVIAVYFVIKLIARFSGNQALYYFVWITRIDCMAIGAIGAFLCYEKKERILAVFFNPVIQVGAWLVLVYSLFFGYIHLLTFIDHEAYSLVFLVIILNVGFNRSTLITLENRFFNFLGRISYGIYVYHMLIIFLFSYWYNKYSLHHYANIYSVYVLIVCCTLLVSYLSFKYFESWFLNIKSKFAIIKSTNLATDADQPAKTPGSAQ